DKPDVAKQVLSFYSWAYKNGGKMAESLDYVPMPAGVVKTIQASWIQNIKDASGKPVWTGPTS
ncbi:MAG TPA: hypothetical protein VK690_06990, partial [Stellaceae bacterium]|nr:hypothetical protein [Stellaceae bacterium]